MERFFFSYLLLAFSFLCYLDACFIRNCPPGGKRSMDLISVPTHECPRCGPHLAGQCFGPRICCGIFGCFIGTPETEICNLENDSTEPCEIRSQSCGIFGNGKCVISGLCCDTESCSMDQKCRRGKNSRELMSLLQTLIQNDKYK